MNLALALKNSQGKIFYGMHFYPGVAQYDNDEGSFRVFVNEATIRKMNPTFAGRPVFVEHVDEVDEDLSQLRNEADGWVIESFYNPADGKHWAKFIVVSDRGLRAIRNGFRLSNAYIPQLINASDVWNGVDYQKTVTDGEFEHLAIVKNPRYDESVIMTPDEYKMYNEKLTGELKRIANSKGTKKENTEMKPKFTFFKRTKVENSVDLEGLVTTLPESKKEVIVTNALAEYDKILNMNGYANGDHMVKVGEKDEMSVNDLVKKHMEACNELSEMKKNAAGDKGGEPGTGKDDVDPEVANEDDSVENEEDESVDNEGITMGGDGDVGTRGGDKSLDNEDEDESVDNEDDDGDEDDKKKKEKTKNELAKKAEAKKKAASLKNAHLNSRDDFETVKVDLAEDQVARGKSRYGSK